MKQIIWLIGLYLRFTTVIAEITSDGISGLVCNSSSYIGAGSLSDLIYTYNSDNNFGFNYIAETPAFTFPCCGRVIKWELIADQLGTIQLQVWRRKNTTIYYLVGENYCTITVSNAVQTCIVDPHDQILVRKGDFIGWFQRGHDMLKYNSEYFTSNKLQNLFRRNKLTNVDVYPGDTVDFSTTEAYNDRDYALQATYTISLSPVISTTNANVTDYLLSGTPVNRFTYQDPDYIDNKTLVVTFQQKSVFYDVNLASGYVTANNEYGVRTDSLAYYVYDQCYKDVTASHTFTVIPTNLQIDNLNATFTLHESTIKTQQLLHNITVTDPTDQIYCTASSWPTNFILKAVDVKTYGVYVADKPSFSCSSSPLKLVVICSENKTTHAYTASGTITAYITCNQPPVLDNLDNYVIVDAETASIGMVIFNATATDPEDDVLTYTMLCTPATTNFNMTKNGNVYLNAFLVLPTGPAVYQYNCEITVTDTYTVDGPNYLHISVANIDHLVTISNMPTVQPIMIEENTPVGTPIYKFEYHDVDPDTKTWTLRYDSGADETSRYFNLDPNTGLLSLAFSEANYEVVSPTLSLIIVVGDKKSTTSGTVSITFINQNEAPWFREDYYATEVLENNDGTSVFPSSTFTVSDEDVGDTKSFSLDCDGGTNTHRFHIDVATGEIVFRGAYDLDVEGTPSQVACVITVQDQLGLTDTANLYIHIKSNNEFTPEFTHPSYTLYLDNYSLVGTYLLTVSANDYDSSDNDDNVITYTTNNDVLAVDYDGAVYLAKSLASYTTSFTVEVLASNYNVMAKTGTTTITISIAATTTTSTTTTTDREKGFSQDPWTYYWLIGVGFGIALIILAVALVCFRICRLHKIAPWCYSCCMQGVCCKKKPHRPPLRGFGDKGFDLASFGYEHNYADEDIEIDGWVGRRREKQQKTLSKQNLVTNENTAMYGSYDRHDNDDGYQKGPLHEMGRFPASSTVPKAANYLDPYTSTRKVPG